MIKDSMARRMGAKFFGEQGLKEYQKMMKMRFYCVDSLLQDMFEDVGRVKMRELYFKLPERLRRYVLMTGTHIGLSGFRELDLAYKQVRDSKRPERLKDFPVYMQKLQEVFLKFLAEGK